MVSRNNDGYWWLEGESALGPDPPVPPYPPAEAPTALLGKQEVAGESPFLPNGSPVEAIETNLPAPFWRDANSYPHHHGRCSHGDVTGKRPTVKQFQQRSRWEQNEINQN